MTDKEEVKKQIRVANIWIAILLFFSALNFGFIIVNAVMHRPFWMILLSTAATICPGYAAYRWFMLKARWKHLEKSIDILEKLNAN